MYATAELEGLNPDTVDTCAWEKELIVHSKSFWEALKAEMVHAAKKKQGNSKDQSEFINEIHSVRDILTLIFGCVYSSLGYTFPKLTQEDVREIAYHYKEGDLVEAFVLAKMRLLNQEWAGRVEDMINRCDLNGFSKETIWWYTKALLDVCEEGSVRTARRHTESDYEDCSDKRTVTDVRQKQKRPLIEPVNVTGITFDDVGGQNEAKEELKKLVVALKSPEIYKAKGTRPPRGVLFVGPGGNGKTLMAKAFAASVDVPFYVVNMQDFMSIYYSGSPNRLGAIFDYVQSTGGILFLDEVDAIAPSRANPHIHEESHRVVSVMLQKMDGFKSNDKMIMMFATNYLAGIDEWLLRPGRVDRIIEVPLPDEIGRKETFDIHVHSAEKLAGTVLTKGIDFKLLASRTEGFSCADIAEIVRRTQEQKVYEEYSASSGSVPPAPAEGWSASGRKGGSPLATGGKGKGKKAKLTSTEDILVQVEKYERVKAVKKQYGFQKN